MSDTTKLAKPLFEPKEKREVRTAPVSKLFVGELNERIEVGDLTALAESIRQVGVLEPLLVRPIAEGQKFEVIAGRRRFEAAKMAGLQQIPVIIKDMDDLTALRASFDENEARKSANPVEQGAQCSKLLLRLQDIREVADTIGRSTQWVKSRIEAYDLHRATSQVITSKGPRGMIEGISSPGLGIIDTSMVQSTLRAPSVQRYIMRKPDTERGTVRQTLAKNLAEAITTVDPSKKSKLISEFKRDPEQDVKLLADRLSKEPSGLKLSLYFPPELARNVQDLAEREGLRPAKWVQEVVEEKVRQKKVP